MRKLQLTCMALRSYEQANLQNGRVIINEQWVADLLVELGKCVYVICCQKFSAVPLVPRISTRQSGTEVRAVSLEQ